MRTWLRIVAWIAGVVGAVLLVLRLFFFDIWTVAKDYPLLAASIEPTLSAGDVVVEVAQEAVSNAADLQKRVDKLKKDGRRTALLQVVSPNGETQFVALSLQ